MHIFPYFLLFSYIFAIFAPFNIIIMSEKFPYGYDVNAYIDKAFERMKKFRIALVMTLALFIASCGSKQNQADQTEYESGFRRYRSSRTV